MLAVDWLEFGLLILGGLFLLGAGMGLLALVYYVGVRFLRE